MSVLNYYQQRIIDLEAEIASIADLEKNGSPAQAEHVRALKKDLYTALFNKLLYLEGWRQTGGADSIPIIYACSIYDDPDLLRRFRDGNDSRKREVMSNISLPANFLMFTFSAPMNRYAEYAIDLCESFISNPNERKRYMKINNNWYELFYRTRSLHPEIIESYPILLDVYPELRQLYPELSNEYPNYNQ